MCGSGVERNVDAALFEVPRNVLPEICQLQRRASGVRKLLPVLITIAAKIKHQAADGICRIDAVADHGVPRRVTPDGLILTECFEKIGERLLGDIFGHDRFAQRNEYRVRRTTVVAGVQLCFPPVEQFQRAPGIRYFVPEIVSPATVGINVVEMLMQGLGKKPGDHGEIFVVMRGEPARVLLRGLGRAARGGSVRG